MAAVQQATLKAAAAEQPMAPAAALVTAVAEGVQRWLWRRRRLIRHPESMISELSVS